MNQEGKKSQALQVGYSSSSKSVVKVSTMVTSKTDNGQVNWCRYDDIINWYLDSGSKDQQISFDIANVGEESLTKKLVLLC